MLKRLSMFIVLIIPFAFLLACQETDVEGDVELLYSRSYQNTHDFEETYIYIGDYDTYVESGYPLDLEEDFFDDHALLSYEFTYSNLGTNIFMMDDFYINDNDQLIIRIKPNEENINVLPAFGPYAMVFSVDKDLYESVENFSVKHQ